VEGLLILDQQVRDRAFGDLDADVEEQFTDFGLAHQTAKVQHQRQGFDTGAKLATIAARQGRTIAFVLRRRVKDLFMKQDVVGADDDILHDHVLVALELGIRRQVGWVEAGNVLAVDGDGGTLAALDPFGGLVALALRGVIGSGWLGVGLNVGFALFALEAVDLIAQALVLCLDSAQVGGLVFEQIEQTDDQGASALVRNTREIEISKHRQYQSGASVYRHDYTRLWQDQCNVSDGGLTLNL
jgi:hypothetical protein